MCEGRVVSRSPVELRANATPVPIFGVAVWCNVSDFALVHLLDLEASVERHELHHGHGLDISDVVDRLEGRQMLGPVDEVQHEIILERSVQSSDLLAGNAHAAHCRVHLVLASQELVVLCMDLVNNALGVNSLLEAIPVDSGLVLRLALDIVEVQNGLELTVGLSGVGRVGSLAESSEPVGSQMVCVSVGVHVGAHCAHARGLLGSVEHRGAKLLSELRHTLRY